MIKENDRVLVNSNVVPGKELVFGVVKEVYPRDTDNVLVVELEENKTLIKCVDKDVTLAPAKEEDPDTITISRAEFRRAVSVVTELSSFECLGLLEGAVVSVAGNLVCNRLERELFND